MYDHLVTSKEDIGDIPTFVKTIRKKLGLTQRQLESITGGGVNVISRYERGITTPTVGILNLLILLSSKVNLSHELLLLKVKK